MSYDLRPTEAELSEARALVGVALDTCERSDLLGDPLETPLHVALGWTDSESVREERRGVSGTTFGAGEVELAFNADVSGWTDALGPVVAQQFGRAWADDRIEVAFRWQRLLREALAHGFATRTHPDAPTSWRETDEAALTDRWAAIRDELGERDDLPADRVTMGVAAAVSDRLAAETEDATLGSWVDLDRGAVQRAGDAAFG
ncbi:hypothetical protein [Halomarina rubra]|uniref:Uncharacterized protein n=1 Tax=Halomarina rubra TaxID=2071873 RepID=A0ABD6B1A0_9EURY|nr:hypothetical protein [Halomarina rubra]